MKLLEGLETTALRRRTENGVLSRDDAGALLVEGVPLDRVCDAVGTPVYVYSTGAIAEAYRAFKAALGPDVSICYAVKANGNLSLLSLLAGLGCGMDIVSGGELLRAITAGAPPGRIVFSGVGKTRSEIVRALEAGIHQFNVESAAELDLIATLAASRGLRAPVALRVNPDIDALTHGKITTGRKGDKFGIAFDDIADLYAEAARMDGIDLVGLAVHIGSQITKLEPYRLAYHRLAELVRQLRGAGHAVSRLDLGGGIGINYGAGPAPDLRDYAAIVRETVGHLGAELTVEPGRRLVGEAGVLVTEVLFSKPDGERDIVIVDAAMNDLMRPALYDAVHPAVPVGAMARDRRSCRIVGPVCESADAFGVYDNLPALAAGDRIALLSAGAYGASMSSTYNARPLVPEVMVDGDRFGLIRRRQSVEDLLSLEADPQWVRAADDGPKDFTQAGATT